MNVLQPVAHVLLPTPGPDLNIPLEDLYKLCDRDAWLYPDALIIAAAHTIWYAPVYGHFEMGIDRVLKKNLLTGQMEPDYMYYTFTCKHDPTHCHMLRACDKRRNVPDSLAPVAPAYTFSQLLFRVMLVIVHVLRPDAIIPTPHTLASDLVYIYDVASIRVRDKFMGRSSGIHLAIDGWSSPLTASFLGIVVFWREGDKLHRAILEFVHLTESHTGVYLAEETLKCLERFGIRHHITSICLDNASNNDTFIRHISPSLPRFPGAQFRTRCIAHIAFMAVFTRPASKKRKIAKSRALARQPAPANRSSNTNPSTTASRADDFELEQPLDELDAILDISDDQADEGMEVYDAGVVQKAVQDAINKMRSLFGLEIDLDKLKDSQSILPKITGFAHQIHASPTLYAIFKSLVTRFKDMLQTGKEVPTKRVATRWDSDLACALTHIELRLPINAMTTNPSFNMSKYGLDDLQWTLLEDMVACLFAFKRLTLRYSQSCIPLLHEVIPDLLVLKYRLTLMRDDTNHQSNIVIRVAAQAALQVLEKYLNRLEESDIYWLAIVLCPWYKLQWFVDQGYSSVQTDRVRRVLNEQYAKYLALTTPANPTPTPTRVPTASASTIPTSLSDKLRDRWAHNPPTPSQSTTSIPTSTYSYDALATYLSSPPIHKAEVEEIGLITYWQHELNKSAPLARMALDILSAPASSVDAERAFSGGRMAVNYRQHRMSVTTFRAKMAVGSWFGTPLLSGIDEVLEVIDGRGSVDSEPVMEPEPLD
ncbi:unnamed protein product [Rhizoctonia solani]|uniref:HAT C-terminal dimerisation domain-containing protein n=1 Tax=Rhizoctonia solani TaxID=456999 RepID=A0A8H3HT78_9AGAM|nr:unnamed protein product [Rhizoctonia solani]